MSKHTHAFVSLHWHQWGFFCVVVVMHTSRRAISSSSAAESLVEIDGSGAATKLAREFSISLASISAFSACEVQCSRQACDKSELDGKNEKGRL